MTRCYRLGDEKVCSAYSDVVLHRQDLQPCRVCVSAKLKPVAFSCTNGTGAFDYFEYVFYFIFLFERDIGRLLLLDQQFNAKKNASTEFILYGCRRSLAMIWLLKLQMLFSFLLKKNAIAQQVQTAE